MKRFFLSSVTRIARFEDLSFTIRKLRRNKWEAGDYVLGHVFQRPPGLATIELDTGRVVEVAAGDSVIGAFGRRSATLEVTGDFREIGRDRRMHALTSAGVFGKRISRSALIPPLLPLEYHGHVMVGHDKARMRDFAVRAGDRTFDVPVILLIGTSMSAGKTTAAKIVIRHLKARGENVVGVKLTGAGRYRDILAMSDAGADHVLDFVDAGLPSTICEVGTFTAAMENLLSRVAGLGADVMVTEIGASPLEPYNGEAAIERLDPHVKCTILCASDPYAVLGVMKAYGRSVDLVAGVATSTDAGIDLIRRLTDLPAADLRRPESSELVGRLLAEKLGQRQ